MKAPRKFTKPNSISQCLKCSICMEVFDRPVRLFCGHTFCFDCLKVCVKSNAVCPICRTIVDQIKLGKDSLAFEIINDLQVYCAHEQCGWKGELKNLEPHLSEECDFNASSYKKAKKNYEEELIDDQEIQQQINENTKKGSIVSRAMKNYTIANGKKELVRKMLGTYEPKKSESKTVESKSNKKNVEFLLELYEQKNQLYETKLI